MIPSNKKTDWPASAINASRGAATFVLVAWSILGLSWAFSGDETLGPAIGIIGYFLIVFGQFFILLPALGGTILSVVITAIGSKNQPSFDSNKHVVMPLTVAFIAAALHCGLMWKVLPTM